MSQKQYKGYVTSAGRQYVPEVNVVPIRRDAQARPFSAPLAGLRDRLVRS